MNIELEEQDNLNFIELAYKISLVDGKCNREEYDLLVKYQQELGINYFPDTLSIDELIEYFSKRDKRAQKTVWLQLYSLIKADQNIDDHENAILNKIKSSFILILIRLSLNLKISLNILMGSELLATIFRKMMHPDISLGK